jgi:anti-anti-sigma factor
MIAPYSICIRMHGEYDIADRDRLQDVFEAAAAAPYVVVDLSKTTYVDSSVLGAFVRLRKRRESERPNAMGFLEPGASLRRLIEIAGLANVFPFFDSLEGAATHFGTAIEAFKDVEP